MRVEVLILSFLIGLVGCNNFPKDPQNTLENVRNHKLIIGYSENPPWVVKGESNPTGIEAALVQGFAETLHATIEWKYDTEQNLFEELEKGNIHMVIAGITEKNPWKKKVGFTRPFVKDGDKKHVMAVMKGENAFIVALEQYMHQHEEEVKERLRYETNK